MSGRARLHVNIDHVATLRNARGTPYPDPVDAAAICLEAGADGITAHLREDRRHIKDDDVVRLRRQCVRTLNLEMAATDEMVAIALAVRPDVVTLVPERREERTTEGGLAVRGGGEGLRARIARLVDAGLKVSLFIAADSDEVSASAATAARQIELHTGEYCHATGEAVARELDRLRRAAEQGVGLGLEVAAGHGLTRANVGAVSAIPGVVELNIGHALISDAVFLSLPGAVRAMRHAMVLGARGGPREVLRP
jgi:pyridoxine 5-phosphate synthase